MGTAVWAPVEARLLTACMGSQPSHNGETASPAKDDRTLPRPCPTCCHAARPAPAPTGDKPGLQTVGEDFKCAGIRTVHLAGAANKAVSESEPLMAEQMWLCKAEGKLQVCGHLCSQGRVLVAPGFQGSRGRPPVPTLLAGAAAAAPEAGGDRLWVGLLLWCVCGGVPGRLS